MHRIVCQDVILERNRSTELTVLVLPEALQSPHVVVAAYLFESESMTLVARHINFHELLKEVPVQRPNRLSCRICTGDRKSTWIEISAEVRVKGVLVEIVGEVANGISFDDNGIDLVPGDICGWAQSGYIKQTT